MPIALRRGHVVINSGGNMAADGMDQPIWSEEARRKLAQVPEFVRPLARTAIEEHARARREKVVTPEIVEAACRSTIPDVSAADAATHAVLPFTLPWSVDAEARVRRIPIAFVRGQVIRRVETYAAVRGVGEVDLTTYRAATSPADSS